MVWAELVMCRVGYVPSLLCAELTRHPVDLQVTSILPMNFESIALSVQEKKFKTRFLRWTPWPQFGISYRNDSSYFFYLQVTPMLPTKFRVNWPFSSEEEGKIDFQDGHHLGFPIGTILATFISTSHPDDSYQFSNQMALNFGSGK